MFKLSLTVLLILDRTVKVLSLPFQKVRSFSYELSTSDTTFLISLFPSSPCPVINSQSYDFSIEFSAFVNPRSSTDPNLNLQEFAETDLVEAVEIVQFSTARERGPRKEVEMIKIKPVYKDSESDEEVGMEGENDDEKEESGNLASFRRIQIRKSTANNGASTGVLEDVDRSSTAKRPSFNKLQRSVSTPELSQDESSTLNRRSSSTSGSRKSPRCSPESTSSIVIPNRKSSAPISRRRHGRSYSTPVGRSSTSETRIQSQVQQAAATPVNGNGNKVQQYYILKVTLWATLKSSASNMDYIKSNLRRSRLPGSEAPIKVASCLSERITVHGRSKLQWDTNVNTIPKRNSSLNGGDVNFKSNSKRNSTGSVRMTRSNSNLGSPSRPNIRSMKSLPNFGSSENSINEETSGSHSRSASTGKIGNGVGKQIEVLRRLGHKRQRAEVGESDDISGEDEREDVDSEKDLEEEENDQPSRSSELSFGNGKDRLNRKFETFHERGFVFEISS